MEEREKWIDICKGIAIILVVIGHVISSYHNSGAYIDAPIFNGIGKVIYSFHMPLFFIISGYLTRFSSRISFRKQAIRKLIAYGIPYVIFSLLMVISKMIASSFVNSQLSVSDLIKILWYPISSLWFIYALLVISILHLLVDMIVRKVGDKSRIGIIILLFCLMYIANLIDDNMIFPNTCLQNCILVDSFKYAFWYEIGAIVPKVVAEKKSTSKISKSISILSVIVFIIIYTVLVIVLANYNIHIYIVIFFLSFVGSILVMRLAYLISQARLLEYIGRDTMPIYLLHTYVISVLRIALSYAHLRDSNGLLPITIISSCSIVISLFVYYVVKRLSIFDFCFYPLKHINLKGKEKM